MQEGSWSRAYIDSSALSIP
jgi:hypothetical protein